MSRQTGEGVTEAVAAAEGALRGTPLVYQANVGVTLKVGVEALNREDALAKLQAQIRQLFPNGEFELELGGAGIPVAAISIDAGALSLDVVEEPLRSFHFTVGGDGPLHCCARVRARTESEAVAIFKAHLPAGGQGFQVEAETEDGLEYLEVYFSPARIGPEHIDEVVELATA